MHWQGLCITHPPLDTFPSTAGCPRLGCASSDTSGPLGGGPLAPGMTAHTRPAGRERREDAIGVIKELTVWDEVGHRCIANS